MKKEKDWSEIVYRSINALLLEHSFETAMGAIFGLIIREFGPVLFPKAFPRELIDIAFFAWPLLGIFLFNIKHVLFPKKLFEDVDAAIDLTEKVSEQAGLSKLEKKQKYLQLLSTAYESLSSDSELKKEIEDVKKQIE